MCPWPWGVSDLEDPCATTLDGVESAVHDARDRLVSRTLDGTVSLVSTYDARGNRTELAEGPATTPFEPTDTTTSTWDVAGKLVGVELPSGLTVTYRYDVAGHLVYRRQEDGSSMVVTEDRFVYDGALLPQARVRYDAEGEVARVDRYVYTTSAHVPDAVVRCDDEACATPVVERVVTDHLGSAVGLVNASSGAWVAETRYDVWGVVIGSALPWDAVPFGFAGGLRDPATGWVLFGARWYDPEEGRWVSADPIGQQGGANLYVYVRNRPGVEVDPWGLRSLDACELAVVQRIFPDLDPERIRVFDDVYLPLFDDPNVLATTTPYGTSPDSGPFSISFSPDRYSQMEPTEGRVDARGRRVDGYWETFIHELHHVLQMKRRGLDDVYSNLRRESMYEDFVNAVRGWLGLDPIPLDPSSVEGEAYAQEAALAFKYARFLDGLRECECTD